MILIYLNGLVRLLFKSGDLNFFSWIWAEEYFQEPEKEEFRRTHLEKPNSIWGFFLRGLYASACTVLNISFFIDR